MPVIVNSFSAHGAFPLSLTMGDDHYFDARADESQRIPASHYPMGRGHVWLCGEDDIDDAVRERRLMSILDMHKLALLWWYHLANEANGRRR